MVALHIFFPVGHGLAGVILVVPETSWPPEAAEEIVVVMAGGRVKAAQHHAGSVSSKYCVLCLLVEIWLYSTILL